MSKASELVKQVGEEIMDEIEWDEWSASIHDNGTRRVLRAIVDELGITREDVAYLEELVMLMRQHGWASAASAIRKAIETNSTLLDAAEADDE